MQDSAHIVVIGSSNIDMIMQVPRLPKPGETVGEGLFSQVYGGKGANQAVAAARTQGQVTFVSCVGDDPMGAGMIAAFQNEGIQTEHVYKVRDTACGAALIFVDESGENSIGVAPGANYEMLPEHIAIAWQAIEKADVILLQLEVPFKTVSFAIKDAAKKGKKILLNPAPARELDDEILDMVRILVVNETEAEMISGQAVTDAQSAAAVSDYLLQKGPELVVLTLGAQGAYVAAEGISELVPGFAVEAVDSTAAGDVFCGSLAVALAEKQSVIEAVRFASAAAAISVTRLGAQPSAPLREEVLSFLEAHPA